MPKRDDVPFSSPKGKGKPKPALIVGIVSLAVILACVAGSYVASAFLPGADFVLVKAEESASGADKGSDDPDNAETPEKAIFVHVEGAVASPGLLELAEGSRVFDAIQKAGGFTEDARRDAVNLARTLADGEQIVVPSVQSEDSAADSPSSGSSASAPAGKVNINTADAAALDSLPGIGASTAARIIADREANGPFKTIEDLKRVSGIGDKKFAQLEGSITVG